MKYLRKGKRSTGFALPLLSLNTAKGPCGEFPDIILMARLAKYWGMNLLQILPVNDTGFETLPYSVLSAFALHPIYVRIADLPELDGFASRAEKLQKKPDQSAAESGGSEKALSDFLRQAGIRAEALTARAGMGSPGRRRALRAHTRRKTIHP